MKTVTLYTSPTCPYCERAKALLSDLQIPYEDHDVLMNPALRQEMAEKYNWMTLPMIVIGDEFVGGYDDLAALHANGQLLPKVEA